MENAFPAIEIMPEEEVLNRIQRQVAGWVTHLLKKIPGGNQAWLARTMNKKQSYINRILANGGSNITLRTVAELEVALKEPILLTFPEFEYKAIFDENYWDELNSKRKARRSEYGLPSRPSEVQVIAVFARQEPNMSGNSMYGSPLPLQHKSIKI